MARARLVSEKISRSIRIQNLPETAQLLFTWMISKLDAEGRMTGEPRLVNRLVFPLKDYSDEQVAEWLDLMEAEKDPETGYGLIKQYEIQGHKFLWMPGFEGEQSSRGGKSWKAKEHKGGEFGYSDIPPPPTTKERRSLSKLVETPAKEVDDLIPTPFEIELQEVIKTYPGWEYQEQEDLAWLRKLTEDYPNITVGHLKGCRDYHSEKPTGKGPWKNRLRNWLNKDIEIKKEKEAESGSHKQEPTSIEKLKDSARPDKPIR